MKIDYKNKSLVYIVAILLLFYIVITIGVSIYNHSMDGITAIFSAVIAIAFILFYLHMWGSQSVIL